MQSSLSFKRIKRFPIQERMVHLPVPTSAGTSARCPEGSGRGQARLHDRVNQMPTRLTRSPTHISYLILAPVSILNRAKHYRWEFMRPPISLPFSRERTADRERIPHVRHLSALNMGTLAWLSYFDFAPVWDTCMSGHRRSAGNRKARALTLYCWFSLIFSTS